MDVFHFPNREKLDQAGADWLARRLRDAPDALLCLATGSSPSGVYARLADAPVWKNARPGIVGLDEWCGLDQRHPATCRFYLEEKVIRPWNVAGDRCHLFDASADGEDECLRMRHLFAELGSPAACVLGLGRNGHLGLNEPGSVLHPHAHVARLTEASRQHAMLSGVANPPTTGMTLGMADILTAREILLLVTGTGKEKPAGQLLGGEISTAFPASFLHLHRRVTVMLDHSVLQQETA